MRELERKKKADEMLLEGRKEGDGSRREEECIILIGLTNAFDNFVLPFILLFTFLIST